MPSNAFWFLLADKAAEGALEKGQNQEWPSNEVSESPFQHELNQVSALTQAQASPSALSTDSTASNKQLLHITSHDGFLHFWALEAVSISPPRQRLHAACRLGRLLRIAHTHESHTSHSSDRSLDVSAHLCMLSDDVFQ